jgi:hypothetical protein
MEFSFSGVKLDGEAEKNDVIDVVQKIGEIIRNGGSLADFLLGLEEEEKQQQQQQQQKLSQQIAQVQQQDETGWVQVSNKRRRTKGSKK